MGCGIALLAAAERELAWGLGPFLRVFAAGIVKLV